MKGEDAPVSFLRAVSVLPEEWVTVLTGLKYAQKNRPIFSRNYNIKWEISLDILELHDIMRLHLQKQETASEALPFDDCESSNVLVSVLLQHHIFAILESCARLYLYESLL